MQSPINPRFEARQMLNMLGHKRRMVGGPGRRNREAIEVIVEVLAAASLGARKSHIMLKANLNSVKAGQLIQKLLSSRLLRLDGECEEGPMYQTTERGLTLINLFSEIQSMLRPHETCAKLMPNPGQAYHARAAPSPLLATPKIMGGLRGQE